MISMRWFVVRGSAPLSKRPPTSAHAQPPGPGFPLHAPSVYTTREIAIRRLLPPENMRRWTHDHRRLRAPAARRRSRGDTGVARLAVGRRRRPGQDPGSLLDVEAPRACPRAPGRPSGDGVDALRQHDPL